jgi:CRISPR-associated protein Cas6
MWDDEEHPPYTPLTVDVVFALQGELIPHDHAQDLAREVERSLPWFADEPLAGIHPIRGALTEHETLVLSRRASLVLRVPRQRVGDCMALSGAELTLGGRVVRVGAARERALKPHSAVHAYYVVTGHDEEVPFALAIRDELRARGTPCKLVCGKPHVIQSDEGPLTAYNLALYDLTDEQSLMLQDRGLGLHHELGCGLFLPHKSFAAVGA